MKGWDGPPCAGRELAVIVIRESPDLVPLCPHCESPLDEVLGGALSMSGGEVARRSGSASATSTPVPNAARHWGISHRKGFWAG